MVAAWQKTAIPLHLVEHGETGFYRLRSRPPMRRVFLEKQTRKGRGMDPPSADGLRNQIKEEPNKKDYRMKKNVSVV
jgi:hypothetical protein